MQESDKSRRNVDRTSATTKQDARLRPRHQEAAVEPAQGVSGPMSQPRQPDEEEQRSSRLDVLIRARLDRRIGGAATSSLHRSGTLMASGDQSWPVTLYPLHRSLARRIGGRQRPRCDHRGLGGVLSDRHAVCTTDEFVWQLHLLTLSGRSTQHTWTSLHRERASKNGRSRAIRSTTSGHRPIRTYLVSSEPAAEDRRAGSKSAFAVASIGLGMLQFLASFIVAGIVDGVR